MLVVEHDEQMMRAADHLVDMGPGAGEHGGRVVAAGIRGARSSGWRTSVTGQFLSGARQIAVPDAARRGPGRLLACAARACTT